MHARGKIAWEGDNAWVKKNSMGGVETTKERGNGIKEGNGLRNGKGNGTRVGKPHRKGETIKEGKRQG